MRYYMAPPDSHEVVTTDNLEVAKAYASDEDWVVIDTAVCALLSEKGDFTKIVAVDKPPIWYSDEPSDVDEGGI